MAEALTEVVLEVSDFVALVNQTFEYAIPSIIIRGELANFKISKNKWVYFDLKDETATVRLFGTVYQLPGPLEDGMVLLVRGAPRLHPRFGFSINVLSIRPEGAGTIRRAAELLQAKLEAEGLFDPARKRRLPCPPATIGLVASRQSAAYADFMKILNARWGGVTITCIDVQVQGEVAPEQVSGAIEQFNRSAVLPDALVVIRGGGSAEDLYAFNTERVTRAVAASRVPTLVAIGHEVDVSLAELAADQRASTPSNAAELLVPDRREVLRQLDETSGYLRQLVLGHILAERRILVQYDVNSGRALENTLVRSKEQIASAGRLLTALDPRTILKHGYAIVRAAEVGIVRHASDVTSGTIVNVELSDGSFTAAVR
jgi:exodeoxyribonuclease VII large subunit